MRTPPPPQCALPCCAIACVSDLRRHLLLFASCIRFLLPFLSFFCFLSCGLALSFLSFSVLVCLFLLWSCRALLRSVLLCSVLLCSALFWVLLFLSHCSVLVWSGLVWFSLFFSRIVPFWSALFWVPILFLSGSSLSLALRAQQHSMTVPRLKLFETVEVAKSPQLVAGIQTVYKIEQNDHPKHMEAKVTQHVAQKRAHHEMAHTVDSVPHCQTKLRQKGAQRTRTHRGP